MHKHCCAELFIAVLIPLIVTPMHAQERSQARSMVITPLGIAATSQTLASQAGAQVLARGGTAMDAAIAANAVLSVVEPMNCGIGGDLFAIYWEAKSGKLTGINASGWAPKELTIEALKSRNITSMPQDGILSLTVPGCVAGWASLHHRFGKLPWKDLFLPAIYFADHGFPVTEIIQDHWKNSVNKLSASEYAKRVFLPSGRPPELGEVFRNPDLARTLEALARGGAAEFYRGTVSEAIVRTSRQLGGVLDAADMGEFEPEWVQPISTTYRDWSVYELPPNGQGIAVLAMLNIMERFPIPQFGPMSPEAFHTKIEAQKLAYQDLLRYVADPRFAKIPVQGMLSREYAAERAALIRTERANCDVVPGNPPTPVGDTIYLSVVDKDGNIASLIQSLYLGFGSGVAVEGAGFHLQNRGALFVLDPEHPNALGPHKRPLHTIIPGFAEKGSVHIGFGIMGGFNQAQAHAQFISNVVDHGMNIQAALEAPRFTKLTFGGCDLNIEGRVPEATRAALSQRGHQLEVNADFSGKMGGGQAVVHDSASGINYGASSPRKDGAAVPEPAPYFGVPARRNVSHKPAGPRP